MKKCIVGAVKKCKICLEQVKTKELVEILVVGQ